MIHGIGTDLVAIARMEALWQRHGERALEKLLAPAERAECRVSLNPGRFLAKRFAAKEAVGKALGTGVAVPATLHAVAVAHDARGKPEYRYDERLAAHMRDNGLRAHLSISDEDEHIVAFALIERCGD